MSIFARQLQYVLAQHGKKFGQLFNIRVEYSSYDSRYISPGTIMRLQRAAQGKHQGSVTLNRAELQAVQKAFSFDEEDVLRLRAALAAESIQRFLLDRIEQEKALLVADALFQLLFDADDTAFMVLRNRMVNNIRNDNADRDEEIMDELDEERDLEQIVEIYEAALFWLDTARVTQNLILRQGYLVMIPSLLTNALGLIDRLPDSGDETSQRAAWRQAIDQAMLEVDALKEH